MQAHSARLYALRPDCEVPVEVEKAAEVARLSDVGPFLEEVLSSTHLDCYVHGNLSLPEAMNLATTLRGIMDAGGAFRCLGGRSLT